MQSSTPRPGQRPASNRYIEQSQQQAQSRDRRLLYIILAALCLLLPPVGLLCAWRSRRTGQIAHAALSALALLSIAAIATIYFRSTMPSDRILPVPVVPTYVGYDPAAAAPTVEPVEIYAGDSAQEAVSTFTVTYNDGTTEDLNAAGSDGTGTITDETGENAGETAGETVVSKPIDPATYVTIVYAVTNNATYFHTLPVCDYQTNSRVLTLDDALAEGLVPCEKCAQEYIH